MSEEIICPGCQRTEIVSDPLDTVMIGWSVQISRRVFVCPDCKEITRRVCDALLPDLQPKDSPYADLHAPIGNGIWCYRRQDFNEGAA